MEEKENINEARKKINGLCIQNTMMNSKIEMKRENKKVR